MKVEQCHHIQPALRGKNAGCVGHPCLVWALGCEAKHAVWRYNADSGANSAALGGFHAKGEGAFEHDFYHEIAVAEADFLQNFSAVLGEKGGR